MYPHLADLTLSAIHSPHQQELCRRRPAHLALKDIGDTAGRAKLSGQTDDKLHDDVGGGRGGPEMLPDRAMSSLLQVSSSILLKHMSHLLNLSLGQSKIHFYSLSLSCLHAGEVVIRHARALPSALALGSAVHLQRCLPPASSFVPSRACPAAKSSRPQVTRPAFLQRNSRAVLSPSPGSQGCAQPRE